MNNTTCMLDCFDACSINLEQDKLKPNKEHQLTNNHLCPALNHYFNYERITTPLYKNNPITIQKAKEILFNMIKDSENSLFYQSNANTGKLQNTTRNFFSEYGSSVTYGSLCDGAAQEGIKEGRGINYMLNVDDIKKSEVVILWGRNPEVSNTHILPLLKNKILIVIDPRKTNLAKKAYIHFQIKPKGDLYLALLLARFIFIEGSEDKEFLENFTEDYEDFYSFTQQYQVKKTLKKIDVSLKDLGELINLMVNKKTVILMGTGIQKYAFGSQVVRAIDSLAATLGYFNKEGCGVGFLGDTSVGIDDPLYIKPKKKESIVTTPFEKYDTIFIQASNPVNQMPNTKTVIEKLSFVKNKIYFGLYENETSKLADLVIPASSFLEKKDIRFSYLFNEVKVSNIVKEQLDSTISEYQLSQFLREKFNMQPLNSEDQLINNYLEQCQEVEHNIFRVKNYPINGYKDRFKIDNELFYFIDEVDDEKIGQGYFLISVKFIGGINSQFKRDNNLFVNELTGFKENQNVKVISKYGEYDFIVKIDNDLREDTMMIYSGAKGLNYLTPFKQSDDGMGPQFQELKIKVEAC